jgi:LuxR family maltose regulon positive regulatory protein
MRSDILELLSGSSSQERSQPRRTNGDLSDAELRVLRYLPSNLTAPAIANELGVSPNTVKTHIWHIYTKLDAHGRAEAVERARRLGVLGPNFRLH